MNLVAEINTSLGEFSLQDNINLRSRSDIFKNTMRENPGCTIARIWNLKSQCATQSFVDYEANLPPEIRRRRKEDFSAASSGGLIWPTNPNVFKLLKDTYRDSIDFKSEKQQEESIDYSDPINFELNSVITESPYDEIFQHGRVADSNKSMTNVTTKNNEISNRYFYPINEIIPLANVQLPKPELEHYFNFIKLIFGEETLREILRTYHGIYDKENHVVPQSEKKKEFRFTNSNTDSGFNSKGPSVVSNNCTLTTNVFHGLEFQFYSEKQISEYNEYLKQLDTTTATPLEENSSEYLKYGNNLLAWPTNTNLSRPSDNTSCRSDFHNCPPCVNTVDNGTITDNFPFYAPSDANLNVPNYVIPNKILSCYPYRMYYPVHTSLPQQRINKNIDNNQIGLEEYSTLVKRMFRQTNPKSKNILIEKKYFHDNMYSPVKSSRDTNHRLSSNESNEYLYEDISRSSIKESTKSNSTITRTSGNYQSHCPDNSSKEYKSFVKSLFRNQAKSNKGTTAKSAMNTNGNDMKKSKLFATTYSADTAKAESNSQVYLKQDEHKMFKEEKTSLELVTLKASSFIVEKDNLFPNFKKDPLERLMAEDSKERFPTIVNDFL